MSKRWQIALGIPFFALMFTYFVVRTYVGFVVPHLASRRGWNAEQRDGRVMITVVGKDTPAEGVLRVGDEILDLRSERMSRMPVAAPTYWQVPVGTTYTLVVRQDGQVKQFTLRTVHIQSNGPKGIFLFGSILTWLLFLMTGVAVFLFKPGDKQAWLLALMLTSLYALIPYTFFATIPQWLIKVMIAAQILSITFLPTFLHFFLTFPEPLPLLRRFPRLEKLIYLPYWFFLLPFFALSQIRNILGLPPWLIELFKRGRINRSIAILVIGYLLCGLIAMLANYRSANAGARRKLRVVMAGSGAGFFNLTLMPLWDVFGLNRFLPTVGYWLDMTLFYTLPLIPISFAYAIVRHQVIPVSLIIRRGVRYVLVSRGSVLLELLAVFVTVTALLTYVFSRIELPGVVNGIVSATVGIITWKLVSRWHDKYLAPLIDRRFFREAYNSQQIIADLTNELRTVTGLPELLELVSTKIQSALKTENVTVFLRDEGTGDYRIAYSCDYSLSEGKSICCQPSDRLLPDGESVSRLAGATTPVEVELRTVDDWQDLRTLHEINSKLLLPLATKDELLGIVSLGSRLGDVPFSGEDKHLLMSVAGPTTFAIENARLLEQMIAEARRREEIEAENEQRAKELEEARQLQLSMLPKTVPQLPGLEIAAYMKTATEVGGDYYDFHLASDGTLTVAVGDATGHGLKAGTVVTAMKSLFHCFAGDPELLPVMNQSSRVLKQMNLRSLFMGLTVIKLLGNRLRVSSAGMPPMLIYRAKGRAVEEVLIKAMPLGSISGYTYREQELALTRGDVVVLMSDGLPERFNPEGEMFDYWRATGALAEIAEGSPREIIEHFVSAGDAWADGRPQDDDVTFVVLKVK